MKIVDAPEADQDRLVERVRVSASDVADFSECGHLTRLDLLLARGLIEAPEADDVGLADLIRRGEEHERRILQRYRDRGLNVVEIAGGRDNPAEGFAATKAAMASGADVIYQGVLTREPSNGQPALLGLPDFLVRTDLLDSPDGDPRPLVHGGHSYEVVDAKLARSAKGRAVAQLAFYSALLADQQGGVPPKWLHLALGNGELASFKVADYAAYERQTRKLLTEFIEKDTGQDPPADTYPEPISHCAVCRWCGNCSDRWRADDDLSLVAWLTGEQRRRLIDVRIETRHQLAEADPLPEVPGISRRVLERVHNQAALQVASEDAGVIQYSLLEPDRDADGELVPNRGLLALPEPAEGDLFFDIEGARFYSEDNREFGLQYLFGIVDTADRDGAGNPRYIQFWAYDREGEKRAFEQLIDFITARRAERPGMHVYHYNHYETTAVDHLSELHETRQEAVGRLMGRYATREDQVDELFRLGVFVDLYRVARQALQAGVESYSIKQLEQLAGYSREVRLRDANEALVSLEQALDEQSAAGNADLREVVAGYNEDDCLAMIPLRDWLEQRRPELAAQRELASVAELPRPVAPELDRDATDSEVTRLREALLASVPAKAADRTPEEAARAQLADLLEWHRRESKPAWWRYFHLRTLSSGELVSEPDALGLLTGGVQAGAEQRSIIRRFSFPPQDHKFSPGDTAHDAITGRGWRVWDVDDERGLIWLKIGKSYRGPLPSALVPVGPPQTKLQAERLRELGERVLADGVTGLDAATALLLRRPPARASGEPLPLRRPDEPAQDAAVRVAASQENSYLAIQGPPGTGKTYTGAEQILALLAEGRSVGITGPSHAAIFNLIDAVVQHAADRGIDIPVIGQRADSDNPSLHPGAYSLEYPSLTAGLVSAELDVAAGTTWMWSRPEFHGSVDTLFVDEAGQMSLADVLAVAASARNLVLLGDPQQLAKPSQAPHPPGAEVSALQHILGPDRATMGSDAGLLLDTTWRMHPDLCAYTSEISYDGKLTAVSDLERQQLRAGPALSGAGLRVVEVPHTGNTTSSREEATKVAELVGTLLAGKWRNSAGRLAPIGARQIMIVTPYNAQIRAIRSALAEAGLPKDVPVGTVDKFQGREAPVVIYSMASSSADNAPRGMEFLYDLHRLNVATSRARAMAIIVASPDLARVPCRTPHQMHLANGLVRAFEVSDGHKADEPPATSGSGEPRRARSRPRAATRPRPTVAHQDSVRTR